MFFIFCLGTSKMQHHCTSQIKAQSNADDTITVEICYTHHGHFKQLEHMRLTKGKRESIAVSLQKGASDARVLTDIREDAINQLDESFKRYHLADKKDLQNIKASFGLNNVKRHQEDQVSVQAWIDEWTKSEGNPVLFYKFQGQECSQEFDLSSGVSKPGRLRCAPSRPGLDHRENDDL